MKAGLLRNHLNQSVLILTNALDFKIRVNDKPAYNASQRLRPDCNATVETSRVANWLVKSVPNYVFDSADGSDCNQTVLS